MSPSIGFCLSEIEEEINEYIGDFDMFLSMVKYGTCSEEFKNSAAGKMYVKDALDINVPRGTNEMLALVEKIGKDQSVFTDCGKWYLTQFLGRYGVFFNDKR